MDSYVHAYQEPPLLHMHKHICTNTYMFKQVQTHAQSHNCQINCSASPCTQISSCTHPVLSPHMHACCSSPSHRCKCTYACAKPCMLHPHFADERSLMGVLLTQDLLPRGNKGWGTQPTAPTEPSLNQQHPNPAKRLSKPFHPANTSSFVLFPCSH